MHNPFFRPRFAFRLFHYICFCCRSFTCIHVTLYFQPSCIICNNQHFMSVFNLFHTIICYSLLVRSFNHVFHSRIPAYSFFDAYRLEGVFDSVRVVLVSDHLGPSCLRYPQFLCDRHACMPGSPQSDTECKYRPPAECILGLMTLP
ncbi:hypothetical protein BJ165DRAFT_446144 [Panaeolus papilionaceus]|nr:hypothetical protein BJ165DRAFT_446144 [Panaeolus papilionaceus]